MDTADEGFCRAAELVGAPYRDDDKLSVRFSMRVGEVKKPKIGPNGEPLMEKRFDAWGREDGEQPRMAKAKANVEWIEIRIPGDRTSLESRQVVPSDRQRFAKAYERFKAGVTEIAGTPIAAMFPQNPALVDEMRTVGIHTVEHLAGLTDGNAQQLGPVLKWRENARRFLAAQKGLDDTADAARRDEEMAELRKQNAELIGAVKRLEMQMASAPEKPTRR